MKGFLFKLMALVAIISLIVMPVYADHSADNDVLGTDDEDESAFSDSYSMDVREVNIDTGEVSEFSIDVPEPQIQPLSDEESPWEQIVRLAGAEGKHPMEYLADLQADMPPPPMILLVQKHESKILPYPPMMGSCIWD